MSELCKNITYITRKDSEKTLQLNVCYDKIQFLNINFCYFELPILKNINLEIKSRQSVGIFGLTGN